MPMRVLLGRRLAEKAEPETPVHALVFFHFVRDFRFLVGGVWSVQLAQVLLYIYFGVPSAARGSVTLPSDV